MTFPYTHQPGFYPKVKEEPARDQIGELDELDNGHGCEIELEREDAKESQKG